MEQWLNQLRDSEKSAILDHSLKKVHYKFRDEKELVEEYNLQTNVVTRRAWRKKDTIGNHNEWEIELGDPEVKFQEESMPVIMENVSQNEKILRVGILRNCREFLVLNPPLVLEESVEQLGSYCVLKIVAKQNCDENNVTENIKNFNLLLDPIISRRNTRTNLEWRIRNLPYPIEVYSITCSEDKKCMTVRTSNKKYFKILNIPELDRLGIPPKQENVSFSHKYNTLIITYKKPQQLIDLDKAVLEIAKEVQPQPQMFDDKNCKQS